MELPPTNKVSVGKTQSVDVCQHGTFERQMCLQLPEERPFLRRSTSPTIVLPGDEDQSVGSSISPSNSNSPCISRRSSSSRKNSGSRKNSFVSCLSPNISPPLSPEYSPPTDTKSNFLSPTNTFDLPKSKVKLLKKTASVKQLYLSVLQALRTISGTKDDVMPELTKTFFEKVLRDFEQKQTLQVTKVKVKDGKEFGRHFCSEVHAVEVSVKLKDASKESVETYQLIIKSQPLSEDARKFLQPNHTFEKEVQMYSTVFVDMANFVKKQGVIPINYHESEIVDIPKCFYARWSAESQVKDDMIIMENLIPKGFVFIEHGDMEINKLHVNLTIREIAKFHAISFCMKEGSTQVLSEKYKLLAKDSLYRKDTYEFTNRTLTPIMASLAELIRSSPLYSDNYEWFVELAKNFHWIQTRMVEPTDKFGVICHGDLWWSNILFRYESEVNQDKEEPISARPREVKFIDFQSARISSLVTDILAFTFTSLSSTLRREHIYQLLELYHSTFVLSAQSLNYTGYIFSLSELKEEFENRILFGFLEGIWYLDIIYQGQRPRPETQEEEEIEEISVKVEVFDTEDEREAMEIKEKEKLLSEEKCSEDQESYKREFFAMLEDVINLGSENPGVYLEPKFFS